MWQKLVSFCVIVGLIGDLITISGLFFGNISENSLSSLGLGVNSAILFTFLTLFLGFIYSAYILFALKRGKKLELDNTNRTTIYIVLSMIWIPIYIFWSFAIANLLEDKFIPEIGVVIFGIGVFSLLIFLYLPEKLYDLINE